MNLSGPILTSPEAFRLQLEVIVDSGFSRDETMRRLEALHIEANREYQRAKARRQNWFIDYFRGLNKRVRKAKELVSRWPSDVGVRIPVSTIYNRPELIPVDTLAAQQIKRGA